MLVITVYSHIMFSAFLEVSKKRNEDKEETVVQRQRSGLTVNNETGPEINASVFHTKEGPAPSDEISRKDKFIKPSVKRVKHAEILELKVEIDRLSKKVNDDIDDVLKLL